MESLTSIPLDDYRALFAELQDEMNRSIAARGIPIDVTLDPKIYSSSGWDTSHTIRTGYIDMRVQVAAQQGGLNRAAEIAFLANSKGRINPYPSGTIYSWTKRHYFDPFPADWLGKTCTIKGVRYTILGWKPGSWARPIYARRECDKKLIMKSLDSLRTAQDWK